MGPKTQPEWVNYTSVYLGSDPNFIISVSEQIQIILLMLLRAGRGFSGRVSLVQITSVQFSGRVRFYGTLLLYHVCVFSNVEVTVPDAFKAETHLDAFCSM